MNELKATRVLKTIGGECVNRCQFADNHYRTEKGHVSRQYTYRAADRAIAAGQINLHPDGRITVKETA